MLARDTRVMDANDEQGDTMPRIHHAISYIEFPCTQPERTQAFYGAVFGWTFQAYGPSYLAFSDGNLNGGFTKFS